VSKIETGRFSDLLRRSLGMKGQELVSAELAPELSPTWQVESALNQEWDWAKGVNQYGGSLHVITGPVGTHFRLGNPSGSGVLVRIESLGFQSSTTGDFTVAVHDATALLASIGIKGRRDTRKIKPAGIINPSVAFFTGQGNVGSVGTVGRIWYQALITNVQILLNTQIMLTEGNCVTFGSDTPGAANGVIQWYERPLPPLER